MTEGARQRGRAAGRTTIRPATWLAWVLWFATIVFGAAILLGSLEPRWSWYVLTHYFFRNPEQFSNVLTSGILIVAVPAYATVGAIVASLRPKNGIGWLCLSLSLVIVLGSWQPTEDSLIALAGALSGLAWFLIVPPLAVTLMLLIYPDGRLPSRRWWVVLVMAVAAPLLGPVTETFNAYPGAELVQDVGWLTSLVALLASGVAIVLRWVRSRGRERQQIKLLVYAVAGTAVALIVALASSYILGDIPGAQSPLSVLASVVAFGGIALGIPVAIGVALLKYRLYDVDTVINRTLVYGLLTVLLVLVYFGSVTATQALFRYLTGQESTLAIVASTLLIAASFTPLRRRTQRFIDRRFYRRKYDARKTLEAFSCKLRDETNLEALNDDLVGVRETMQPAHVGLWLREPWQVRDSSRGNRRVLATRRAGDTNKGGK